MVPSDRRWPESWTEHQQPVPDQRQLLELSNGNYKADKGSGSLDQRHAVRAFLDLGAYLTNRTSAFYKYGVNNWQLSNITTMQSGQPTGNPLHRQWFRALAACTVLADQQPVSAEAVPRRRAHHRVIPIGDHYKLGLTFDCFWSPTGFTSSQAPTEAKGF